MRGSPQALGVMTLKCGPCWTLLMWSSSVCLELHFLSGLFSGRLNSLELSTAFYFFPPLIFMVFILFVWFYFFNFLCLHSVPLFCSDPRNTTLLHRRGGGAHCIVSLIFVFNVIGSFAFWKNLQRLQWLFLTLNTSGSSISVSSTISHTHTHTHTHTNTPWWKNRICTKPRIVLLTFHRITGTQ